MGIQINGQNDNISATDGGLTISDLEINQSGISTFNAGVGIGDSIFHLGDDDTQIRFPAADTVSIETAGSERLHIDSNGDLGINITNPTEKLHVSGNIKLTAQLFQSMPADYWAQGNTFIELNGMGNLTHMGSYQTCLTSNGYRNSSGQWTSYAINSTTGASQIKLDPTGYIAFGTEANKANGSTHTVTERLRIASDGDVGIGTNSPVERLHVHKASATGPFMYITNTSTGVSASDGIQMGFDGNNSAVLKNNENTDWIFYTNGSDRLRIKSDGKVGIGTITPYNPLEVVGSSADIMVYDTDAYSQNVSGGALAFAGNDSAGNRKTLADVRGVANGANIGEFAIRTRRSGGTLTEGLRIDSGGRIFTGNDTTLCNSEPGSLHISGGGTNGSRVSIRGTATGAGNGLAEVFAFWDTNKVAGMIAFAGEDTTNKDDGKLNFYTADGSGVQARLKISKEGYVTKPQTPTFSAVGSNDAISAQSPLPYDSVEYNNGNHYSNSTFKFTCPVTGYYYITCHVVPKNYSTGGNNVELYIKDQSGNRYFLDRKVKTNNYSTNNFSVGGSRILYKSAGNTLWVEFNAISGSPLLEGSSHFGITLMA